MGWLKIDLFWRPLVQVWVIIWWQWEYALTHGSYVAPARPAYWCLLALTSAVLGCFAPFWANVGDDG